MAWTTGGRPRHQVKEFEALLRRVEAAGWRVTRGKNYYHAWCPCDKKHHRSVPLTPSVSRTLLNTTRWFERQDCWKEPES